MVRLRGSRGQSTVLGSMFVFAFVVLAVGGYQTMVVPNQNAGVEFEAYEDAKADMTGLHNDLLRVGAGGGRVGRTVETGVSYPSRALTVNPGPPSGSIATTATAAVTLSGVAAEGETGDFWTGDAERTYDTRRIVFRPAYNYIDAQPIVATGELAYTRTESGAVKRAQQTLVRGNRVSLVTVAGEFATSGDTVSVTTTPVSTNSRTVAVTADPGSDPDGDGSPELVLALPTDLSTTAWERILAPELDTNGGNVDAIRAGPGDTVEILLQGESGGGTVTYDLRLSRVEVGGPGSESGSTETPPAYLTDAGGDGSTTTTDGNTSLTVEVRDALNSPESGIEVTFETTDGTFSSGGNSVAVDSDENGRATVSFSPDATGAVEVTAKADLDGSGTVESDETVTFDVEVSSGGGDGSEINPSTNSVALVGSEVTSFPGPSSKKGIEMTLRNNAGEDRTVDRARFAFVTNGQSGSNNPDALRLNDDPNDELGLRGSFVTITQDIEITSSGTETIELHFYEGNNKVNFKNSGWVVVTIVYENGESTRYFAGDDGN